MPELPESNPSDTAQSQANTVTLFDGEQVKVRPGDKLMVDLGDGVGQGEYPAWLTGVADNVLHLHWNGVRFTQDAAECVDVTVLERPDGT